MYRMENYIIHLHPKKMRIGKLIVWQTNIMSMTPFIDLSQVELRE